MDILKKIVAKKKQEIARDAQQLPLQEIKQLASQQQATLGFINSLAKSLDVFGYACIAEIKKASPSKGLIREDFDVVAIAKSYYESNASCLSVLTDEDFFQGKPEYIKQVKQVVDLPVLRKDFIIDPWQIYQSRALGADCILLIAAILSKDQISNYCNVARDLSLDVIIEVHTQEQLSSLPKVSANAIIGINNRDLKTFATSLETSINLQRQVDNPRLRQFLISESGINSSEDVKYLRSHGLNIFLIGEGFMKIASPGKALAKLFSDL